MLCCAAVLLAGAAAPSALACHPTTAGFAKSEHRLAMDDGATIAATLYVPNASLGGCDHRAVFATTYLELTKTAGTAAR